MGIQTHIAAARDLTHSVTPLLCFLAGPHTQRIARIWPAPHEGFLTLPTARRHAAAILLSRTQSGASDTKARIQKLVTYEKDSMLAQEIRPDAQAGLIKTLSKLGETLWLKDQYDTFLQTFVEPNANRILRHLNVITPDTFEPIKILPPLLREAKIVSWVTKSEHAYALAQAYFTICHARGKVNADNAARRWAKAVSRANLFDKAIEDVYPPDFNAEHPRPALPAQFEPVNSVSKLKSAALDFQNCLRDFVDDIARGRMLIFVCRGEHPAAIALTKDAAGWRLAEAEGKKNTRLPDHVVLDIAKTVSKYGVRTGPSLAVIVRRLNSGRDQDSYIDPLLTSPVELLELGDLWA
jgi:hypothetical protein